MTGLTIGLAVAGGCLLLDRALLAAERRGWVRWQRSPPSRASASTALLEILSIYEPAHRHVIEERRAADSDEAEDDDPLDRRATWPPPRAGSRPLMTGWTHLVG